MCVHHWMLDSPDATYRVHAVCQSCGLETWMCAYARLRHRTRQEAEALRKIRQEEALTFDLEHPRCGNGKR